MPQIVSVFNIISASWICKHSMTGGISSSWVLRLDETYNSIVECSKMNAFLVNWLKNPWPNTYNSQTFNNIIESSCISNVFQVFPFHVFSPLLFCFLFFVFFFLFQFILEERFADDQVQSFPAPLEDTRSGLNDPDRWTATRLVTCTICDPFFFSSSSSNQKTRYILPYMKFNVQKKNWTLAALLVTVQRFFFPCPVGFAPLVKRATKAIR